MPEAVPPLSSPKRLLVIGLDSAPPEFLFDRCLPVMPNVQNLLRKGVRAPLRTTDPPVSVPAWPVMFTGVDPGTLGFYGFRHRMNNAYTRYYSPTSTLLPVPSLWKLLSDRGKRVCVIGMPPGYPPPKLNGFSISDFLTPDGARDITYPPGLKDELEAKFGPYEFDVVFRAEERVQLYQDIRRMTEKRWSIAEDLYQREPWDVFAVHEIGVDRLHHAYTKYFDPEHQDFVPGNPFEHIVEEYYQFVDTQMGRILRRIDDQTLVIVSSDHGSMPMRGCFCINQWLAQKGYLRLQQPPPRWTPLEKAEVDWGQTTVWSAGGYYARIFFNLAGREPQGVVRPEDLASLKSKLIAELNAIPGPDGNPLGTRVLDPKEIYRTVRGDPPDLIVYFGNLYWRSAGTLGHPTLYLRSNDTGPDDAVHGMEGIFVAYDPRVNDGRKLATLSVIDVTPTILQILGEEIPQHVQGHPVPGARPQPSVAG